MYFCPSPTTDNVQKFFKNLLIHENICMPVRCSSQALIGLFLFPVTQNRILHHVKIKLNAVCYTKCKHLRIALIDGRSFERVLEHVVNGWPGK